MAFLVAGTSLFYSIADRRFWVTVFAIDCIVVVPVFSFESFYGCLVPEDVVVAPCEVSRCCKSLCHYPSFA